MKFQRMGSIQRIRRFELSFLVASIICTFLIFERFEISEFIYDFSSNHEHFELDEIILTVAFSFLFLSVYTVRRYFELKRTYRHATTDPMVDALNRRGGLELLQDTWDAQQTKKEINCLILFDIDNFKLINDEHGHDIGDVVLESVTSICISQLRSTDALIRWGGEEFLILCKNTPPNEASNLAERIRYTLSCADISPVTQVTASFGVAMLASNKPLRDSIKIADQMQYRSKEKGKNRVTSEHTDLKS